MIAPVVDPSLSRDIDDSLQTAFDVLNEMAAVGNSVADCRKSELEQLRETLKALESIEHQAPSQTTSNDGNKASAPQPLDSVQPTTIDSMHSDIEYMSAHSFDMEEVLSSEQLEAVANAIDFNGLDWTWAANSLDQLDPSLL